MRNQDAEERYKVTLRINRDLLEEIRKAAQRDNRTVNSYLTHQLIQLTNQDRPKAGKK